MPHNDVFLSKSYAPQWCILEKSYALQRCILDQSCSSQWCVLDQSYALQRCILDQSCTHNDVFSTNHMPYNDVFSLVSPSSHRPALIKHSTKIMKSQFYFGAKERFSLETVLWVFYVHLYIYVILRRLMTENSLHIVLFLLAAFHTSTPCLHMTWWNHVKMRSQCMV